MEIKKLDATDIALFSAYILWNTDAPQLLPEEEYLKQWLENEQNHVFLMLDAGKIIAGLTAFTLPMYAHKSVELFIYELDVAADLQGRGIGTQLVQYCLDWCRHEGIYCTYVATEPDNYAANRVYAKAGGRLETINWWVYDMVKDSAT